MDIQPLVDIVIIKMHQRKVETTKSGLALPEVDAEKEQIRWGEVIAVGPGSFFSQGTGERIPIDVKVGDTAGVNGHAPAIELADEGEKYLMVNAPSIICFRKSSRK